MVLSHLDFVCVAGAESGLCQFQCTAIGKLFTMNLKHFTAPLSYYCEYQKPLTSHTQHQRMSLTISVNQTV